jgi:4-oxalocrotonate tautomerase family enzyme
MPFLEISMWKGFEEHKKEKLISELTDVVMKVVEYPREAVHIIIREEPRENWVTGGIQHSKKFKEESNEKIR